MTITKFIPHTDKIRDHRNPSGGFYEAVCNSCGTIFYPKRGNTKYCTPKCALDAHRKAVVEGTATKRAVSTPKKEIEVEEYVIRGRNNVYQFLKDATETRGFRMEILEGLDKTKIGGEYTFGEFTIRRITNQNYGLR